MEECNIANVTLTQMPDLKLPIDHWVFVRPMCKRISFHLWHWPKCLCVQADDKTIWVHDDDSHRQKRRSDCPNHVRTFWSGLCPTKFPGLETWLRLAFFFLWKTIQTSWLGSTASPIPCPGHRVADSFRQWGSPNDFPPAGGSAVRLALRAELNEKVPRVELFY